MSQPAYCTVFRWHFIILFYWSCFNLYQILKISIELVRENANDANTIQSFRSKTWSFFLPQKLVWEVYRGLFCICHLTDNYQKQLSCMCTKFLTGIPILQIWPQGRGTVSAQSIHCIWKHWTYYECMTVILPLGGLMLLKSARYPIHPQRIAQIHSPLVKSILT